MNEAAIRDAVVEQAREWIGKNEADGSHKTIIDIYNTIRPLPRNYKLTYKDQWCAGNVSAVAQVCGLTDIIFPECSCSKMIEKYKAAGRWMENDAYIPFPGDILFYGWSDSGKGDYAGPPDHVGIVESCDGKTITVIEGNYQDSVKRRTIAVNARYIRGFGLPDSASKVDGPAFSDVPEDAYYSKALAWGVKNGVVAGFPDGTFRPDEFITRADAVLLEYRLACLLGAD